MTAQVTRTGREWSMTQRCIDLLAEHAVKLLCIRERLLFSDKGETPKFKQQKSGVSLIGYSNPIRTLRVKVKTYFDTKCTPFVLFVKRVKESL